MQASQIDPAKTYAVKIDEPKTATTDARSYIARFKVSSVESHMHRRQLKPTSADYTHKIYGAIDERDVPPELLPKDGIERQEYLRRTIKPESIEDEYTKYVELKERAEAEKIKAAAEVAERDKQSQTLANLFYQLSGLTPSKKEGWRDDSPFAIEGYGHVGVRIHKHGVPPLTHALQTLLANTSHQKPADK